MLKMLSRGVPQNESGVRLFLIFPDGINPSAEDYQRLRRKLSPVIERVAQKILPREFISLSRPRNKMGALELRIRWEGYIHGNEPGPFRDFRSWVKLADL